jgi:hypothetical protein
MLHVRPATIQDAGMRPVFVADEALRQLAEKAL